MNTTNQSRTLLRDGFVLVLLLLVDLGTKFLFFDKALLSGEYFFSPVLNQGISFSIYVPHLIIYTAIVFAIVVFGYLYRMKILPRVATLLFLAGTLGNFYDRVVRDGVRDFIVFPQLFVCNIADIFLFVAACITLYVAYSSPSHKSRTMR